MALKSQKRKIYADDFQLIVTGGHYFDMETMNWVFSGDAKL